MKTFLILFYIFSGWMSWSEREDLSRQVEKASDSSYRIKKLKVKQISDLTQLSPFNEVSVIQKRYLPKTSRFEIGLGLDIMLDDNFYYIGGGTGHLEFFIREKHSLALEGGYMFHSQRPVSTYLAQPPNSVQSYNLIISQMYGGAYYKWSPFYGKFSVLNKKIVYFDMFFTFGGGITKIVRGLTDKELEGIKDGNVIDLTLKKTIWPTGSLGFGQVFALSKDFGFNWNLKWRYYLYSFTSDDFSRGHVDLSFSLGLNYYFPGAKYR